MGPHFMGLWIAELGRDGVRHLLVEDPERQPQDPALCGTCPDRRHWWRSRSRSAVGVTDCLACQRFVRRPQ